VLTVRQRGQAQVGLYPYVPDKMAMLSLIAADEGEPAADEIIRQRRQLTGSALPDAMAP